MAAIFISYRRDDSAGFAGALEREIATRLGLDRVFMDIKDIEGGTEFPAAIDSALKTSEVVLVLIGPRWLDARDGQRVQRLDQPDDFVRQEVARALKSEARVIPVLIEGTKLPAAEQLPVDLQTLPIRQARELRNSHWNEDIAALMNDIRESISGLETRETAIATPVSAGGLSSGWRGWGWFLLLSAWGFSFTGLCFCPMLRRLQAT